MRSHGRVRNAGPNDSIYRPIALAVLEASMDQYWTATAAAPVWRVTGSTLTTKQLRTRLNVGRSGLDGGDHGVRAGDLDGGSQVRIGARHHGHWQRRQPTRRDRSAR